MGGVICQCRDHRHLNGYRTNRVASKVVLPKGGDVTSGSVREYVDALRERYGRASKKEKGRILDEFCQATGRHRKAAIRLLGARGGTGPPPKKKGRPERYGPELTRVLVQVWEAGDRMCGKLLTAVLPDFVGALERHGELRLAAREREALLAMSASTIDRRLRRWRRSLVRQPRRKAPATTTLKSQIPIRTWSEWQDVTAGSVQADMVLHCGESGDGFYLATLTVVDVASGWVELRPSWGLGASRVRGALHRVAMSLPFALRELHTDNGSEFINHSLQGWCRQHDIRFSRGRGYKKNDQAYVEQRNWLAVRRVVGYDRYASKAAFDALERLYKLQRLQLNFFRPVSKLLGKERIGAKTRKRYDTPKTPYQRLVESGVLDDATQSRLQQQLEAINPADLNRRIERSLRRLWDRSDRREQRKVG